MVSDSVVQQPEYKAVDPGDSVTLSCSVHTDHCAAEHTRVMWLKTSDRSPPELIYSKNNSCHRMVDGETTCLYEHSCDHSATFYCVVTSCGQMLIGNGTRIVNSKTSVLV